MAEPAVQAISTQFHGRRFTRSRLRDQMGPSTPSFHLLESLAFRDVFRLHDDFAGVLNTDLWTATNNGAGAASFALAAGRNGLIQGDAGIDDDGDSRIISNATSLPFSSDRRCAAIFRIYLPAAVTNSKFEVGFIDAAGAGAVNVKATPTSTRTDYAVVIRDTDDDTNISMITDGTTNAVASVDGVATIALTTFYDIMIALNENKEANFWVNSVFQGKLSSGPNITTGLSLWAYIQDRDDVNNKQMNIDYISAWQERVNVA